MKKVHPNSQAALDVSRATRTARAQMYLETVRADVLRDHAQGLTIHALCAKYHIHQDRISRVLHEAGVVHQLKERAAQSRVGKPLVSQMNRKAGITGRPSSTEWASIAAWFDAEGSIIATHPNKSSSLSYYHIVIAQNGTTLHDWLQATLGAGRVYKSSADRPLYTFQLHGQREVFEFLCGVRPYLRVKRVRVEEALANIVEKYKWVPPGSVVTGS